MEHSVKPVPEKTFEELKEIFKPFDIRYNPEKYRLHYPEGLLRKASVLIPLCFKNGEYHLILTLRSEKLTYHAGEVAFPGGMKDDSDIDEVHTALREAEEEIGVNPEQVQIVGVFPQGILKPNSLVCPVIGLVSSDYVPVVNEKEVSLVFEIPLRRFLSTERFRISDFKSSVNGTYHVHHFIDNVNGKEVDTCGYTASLCVYTALGIYQTDHNFSFYEHFIINKDTLFEPVSTRLIVRQMLKLAAQL